MAAGDFQAGLHFLLTIVTLAFVGVLVYYLIKDRRKIETAIQQAQASFENLQSFGQTANCLSCKLCSSTNPTIQYLVSTTGICDSGTGGCIDTSTCPTPPPAPSS